LLFSDLNISQGSVATPLRGGRIFSDDFTASLLVNLPVQEFWKSVSIRRCYGQKSSVLFFLTHSVEQASSTTELTATISPAPLSLSLCKVLAQHFRLAVWRSGSVVRSVNEVTRHSDCARVAILANNINFKKFT